MEKFYDNTALEVLASVSWCILPAWKGWDAEKIQEHHKHVTGRREKKPGEADMNIENATTPDG